jgi:hypothetical protein
MNVKNYTSGVDPTVSMAKIEKCLIDIGASNINKRYVDKICTGITFLIFDVKIAQTIPFHFTADIDGCFKVFDAERKRKTPEGKAADMLQANRTAWKIMSDWVELQCSMILLKQATPLKMFLSYVYDVAEEESFHDKIVRGKINLLPAPKE